MRKQRKRAKTSSDATADSSSSKKAKARKDRVIGQKLTSLERQEQQGETVQAKPAEEEETSNEFFSADDVSDDEEEDEDNDYARNWEDEDKIDDEMENGGSADDAVFE